MNKILLVLALTFGCLSVKAQQDPMYTHYMNNTLSVNPAYAGSRDALTVTALQRMQWVNFNGAPITQSITMHTPLRNEHIGIGLSILNDKIGRSDNTSVFFDYAFIMKLNAESKLSLGLSAGVNLFQANWNSIILDQPNDPTFQNSINNRIIPNFGFGAYYSRERFYAGFSIPDLLQNNYSVDNALIGKEQRHYFFIAGAVLNLNENLAFKPTTLIKLTNAAPVEAELTASFIILKKVLVGAMFRTGDAFGGLVGFDITDQFHIGYSYDWSFGLQTLRYNQGSHELVLRYDFLLFDKRQIHSPRYF